MAAAGCRVGIQLYSTLITHYAYNWHMIDMNKCDLPIIPSPNCLNRKTWITCPMRNLSINLEANPWESHMDD